MAALITECEPSTTSREATFAEVQARTGGEFVHPYNDPRVIAGQATCSAELLEQTGGAGRGGCAHRRRWHGVGHLPDAVEPCA